MAQADNSLSLHNTFRTISASAVHVLARLAAKRQVVEQLRNEGRRVTLIPPAEINPKVRAYLAAHPELYEQAIATAWEIAAKDQRGRMSKWLFDDERRGKWAHRSSVKQKATYRPLISFKISAADLVGFQAPAY
jgi:hypothetical protein